jgi:alkaline phosphatase D
MDRRTLLRGGVAGVGGVAAAHLLGCAPLPGAGPVDGPFDCGVASGLHAHDASVIWTRFAPGASGSVELRWQVATDPSFRTVVRSGSVVAAPASDGCAKVLVEGLLPATTYWYRFDVDGALSPVGRTRTPAAPGERPGSVRLAVASCQSYSAGFYPAWRAVADTDLDGVVFLGDYIYEGSYSSNPFNVRRDAPAATDLDGYRAKYRHYRSDANLRAAHAAHAFAPVWDDHEFVNDCNRLTLLEQPARAAAAYRAWFEYQPVWRTDGDRIHRRLRWGDLVDLSLLDTRQYRDPGPGEELGESPAFGSSTVPPLLEVHSPDRTLLGAAQREWFLDGLGAAQDDDVTWKLVGNQVMISPLRVADLDEPAFRALDPDLPEHAGIYANFDDWNGFMVERDVVSEHLRSEGIGNVAFLTGDIHAFFQSSVLADFDEPFSPAVAQEFVCGSISSRGLDYLGEAGESLSSTVAGFRPDFRFVDLVRRGFGLVECTPSSSSVEYHVVDTLYERAPARRMARFEWPAGTQQVSVTNG